MHQANPICLIAESGSDIDARTAARLGITIVPMHVAFDGETLDDGAFPVRRIVDDHRSTGRVPTTSGCTPEDFARAFDALHAARPDAHLLYLAYSAVTTCSYQSAVLAAQGRDYVTMLDTRQVSAGQCAVVTAVAELMQRQPGLSPAQVLDEARDRIDRVRMCFMPDNLQFLRAGGRVSNAAAMGARILSLHPCIELQAGRLVATRKYRGKMQKLVHTLITDYSRQYDLEKDCIWLVCTIDLADTVRQAAEAAARECGFRQVRWVEAGGVITTHGGPGAFGLAGFARK